MKTADFDYHLPPNLIAQVPMEPRDQSRLLVVDRSQGAFRHTTFSQLPTLLKAGDLLVCNDSRVIPARLLARKAETGGQLEILLLRRAGDDLWEALLKPSRRLHPGLAFRLLAEDLLDAVEGQVVERTEAGTWLVSLPEEMDLERVGRAPVPPYIREPLGDPERYQTVYARAKGSVAAPTAGLHFTTQLLNQLHGAGIGLAFLTMHIGLDTFRPVLAQDPRDHPIHAEWGELPEITAQQANQTRQKGSRMIAVGTSSVRLLETAASSGGQIRPFCGWTRLFILPGHRFQVVDALLTNFHLPRTTLLMLVSAFAGRELILEAYQEAIREGYRFYSFGDAMLIL